MKSKIARQPSVSKKSGGPLANNRKATFDVAVDKTFEAGIVLTGDEIKSVRAKRLTMTGSYVKLLQSRAGKRGLPEAVLIGLHLAQAKDPERSRRLLLHKDEIVELQVALAQKGNVAVPLELHIKRGWAKVSIGVGTGRKQHDKRQLLRERDLDREQRRTLKGEP